MGGRDAPVVLVSRREHSGEVDDDRCNPQRAPERSGADEPADDDERGRDDEEGEEAEERRKLCGSISEPPGVEDEVEDANERVRDREPEALVAVGMRHGKCHEECAGHAGEEEQLGDLVLDIDRVRHPGEARPGPPDEREHERRPAEAGRRRVAQEQHRDLRDRKDEDEVEEQLEVARAALFLRFARDHPRRFCGDLSARQRSPNRYTNGPRPCL